MKIFIKNMVCQGTRKFVLSEIKRLGLGLKSFETDELEFNRKLSKDEYDKVLIALNKYGLQIMLEKNRMVQDVKIGFYTPEPLIKVKNLSIDNPMVEEPVLTGELTA
ncbi:MAG: hypothetical protein ACM3NR_02250 [Methanosarcina sp.]